MARAEIIVLCRHYLCTAFTVLVSTVVICHSIGYEVAVFVVWCGVVWCSRRLRRRRRRRRRVIRFVTSTLLIFSCCNA
jgi:hypothetical protein